ncbi:carbohydrate sulfotransferase 5-like [Anabrus simplex]|uniref:carbohydrate sulfotransferase 5-like n=1 Tax=Anabrus simplex TaxID=316456 RepID=UPI0035A2C949
MTEAQQKTEDKIDLKLTMKQKETEERMKEIETQIRLEMKEDITETGKEVKDMIMADRERNKEDLQPRDGQQKQSTIDDIPEGEEEEGEMAEDESEDDGEEEENPNDEPVLVEADDPEEDTENVNFAQMERDNYSGEEDCEGSLEDLVPELGGQPVRNIIFATWRSGSTFLADVLNSHPANYYHYEPLLDYDIVQIRGEPLASGALRKLKALLNCNYTGLDHYLEYGKEHVWLFFFNTRLWDQCLQHPHLCWLPEFLGPFCRLFPFQSMKVVRLRLRLAEELLDDPTLNVRVLLLVRDPRGTLQSRKHRDWCPGNPDCMEPARLCADLVSDYGAAVHLSAKYPQRFRVVRYEDLSVEPYLGVRDLFQFFGLDFHPSVQQFLDTHTKVDVGGVSSTYRNSKSAPFHWRQDLSHLEVRSIQRSCHTAMDHWGYILAANSSHQREFNPLGEFLLT